MAIRLNIRWLRSFVGVVIGVGTILACTQGARGQAVYELFHAFPGFAVPGPLMQASDGNFYGTTASDGANGCGSVFRITAAGAFTTLHFFHGQPQGCAPLAGVIQARDGNFYGTTYGGGAGGTGTVFRITTAGIVTTVDTLHSFSSDCTQGCFPQAGLIQEHASDGNFYGTTYGGGASSGGTVFKITTTGTFTRVYSFGCNTEPFTAPCSPVAGLIQAADGDFYGTTESGGGAFAGTVFKITAAGTLTTLHSFDCVTDGCLPRAGLIQSRDGTFYGTTSQGGRPPCLLCSSGFGTVFRITTAGTFTTLHSFEFYFDGQTPQTRLIQASDGNFYGTTATDDDGGWTVFKITPAGTLTTLHFSRGDCVEGCEGSFPPPGGLIQASEGTVYGTVPFSGPEGGGVLFRLVGGLSELSPASVWVGLKNSDDVGLRLDLLAEVLVNGTQVGKGRLDNVTAGSSGFNNAVLRVIPLALTAGRPVDFPVVATIEVKVSVRRTCFGGGHSSGIVRLWYNGYPFAARGDAADSRLGAVSETFSGPPRLELKTYGHFIRAGFALSTTPGRSRQSIDVSVDTKQTCPDRLFKPFGIWSNNR